MYYKVIRLNKFIKKRKSPVKSKRTANGGKVSYRAFSFDGIGTCHDLKTLMTSVVGYLNLLDEVCDMPKAQQEKYMLVQMK